MVRMTLEIKNNKLPKAVAELKPGLEAIVAKWAFDAIAGAEQRTPPRVDTGAMMAGWQANKTDELEWTLSNTQDYAIYNELGTVKMAAHPMLIPAAEEVQQSAQMAFDQLVERFR